MSKLSRRDFLKVASTAAGATTLGAILAACGVKPASLPPKPPAVSVTEGAPSPTAETQATTDPAVLRNLMAVVRNGEPEALVRRALDVFGGMGTFVKPGANVIIKPNICVAYRSYEQAATTNPWVVGALVKLCFEAGAGRVRVMDSPFDGTANQAYQYFKECNYAGRITNRYGVSNEETRDHSPILICRGLRKPWLEMWKTILHFG